MRKKTSRIIAIILFSCLLVMSFLGVNEAKAAPSGLGTYKVIASVGLNVRSSADIHSSRITTLKYGTTVDVTQLSGDWGYIPAHNGWINLNYAKWISSSTTTLTSANIADDYYIIKIKSDPSKVVDVEGARLENGVFLQIWEEHGGDNQIFYLERQSDDSYKIIPKHSNLPVEVRNSSHENEAEIAQWEYVDGYNCKLWYIIDCGNGYFKFINKESLMCMDVQGNGTENGVRVQQYEDNGTDAQRFQLIPVNGTKTGTVNASGGLRLRKGRGTQYAKLTTIPNGSKIEITEIQSNWGKVTYAGHTGYVSMDYVVLEGNNNVDSISGISLNVTDMKQYDSKWKSVQLGKSGKTIGSIGCCVTSLAMTESYRTGSTITPKDMAGKLSFTSGGSLYWPSNYNRYYGTDYLQKIYDLLSERKPVLVCGFTSAGEQHWIVVKAYNGGGLSASNFTINDPGSSSRKTLQDFFDKYSRYSSLVYYN